MVQTAVAIATGSCIKIHLNLKPAHTCACITTYRAVLKGIRGDGRGFGAGAVAKIYTLMVNKLVQNSMAFVVCKIDLYHDRSCKGMIDTTFATDKDAK